MQVWKHNFSSLGTTEPIPGVIDVPGAKPPEKAKLTKGNVKSQGVCNPTAYQVDSDSDESQSPAKKVTV